MVHCILFYTDFLSCVLCHLLIKHYNLGWKLILYSKIFWGEKFHESNVTHENFTCKMFAESFIAKCSWRFVNFSSQICSWNRSIYVLFHYMVYYICNTHIVYKVYIKLHTYNKIKASLPSILTWFPLIMSIIIIWF